MSEINELLFGKLQVSKLLGHNFFIPNYQRGYRWEKQQVVDLLDDLKEFIDNTQETDQNFYCLQPIVTKLCNEETIKAEGLNSDKDNNVWYEVIDGQQRLTTLFILLSYLEAILLVPRKKTLKTARNKELFELEYETRKETRGFLSDLSNKTEKDALENIDCYYIWKAYQEIDNWFGTHDEYLDKFLTRLVTDDKCNVQIIWYRTDIDKSEDIDPIATFNRINIGKIPRTNAELIKALFMLKHEEDAKSDSEKIEQELKQIEISKEWDYMESRFHDEAFWAFLNKTENLIPARIEYLFNAIYIKEKKGHEQEFEEKYGKDNYSTFRFFNERFKSCKDFCEKDENQETFVDREWYKVKKYFAAFEDWYTDSICFHYIGFLIWSGMSIRKIYEKYDGKTKDTFYSELRKLIKKTLTDSFSKGSKILYSEEEGLYISWNKQEKKTIIPMITQISYEETYSEVRKLLLLYNLEYLIQKKESYTKFPFHLFKNESWDIEHIDSQTMNELDDKTAQNAWIEGTISDMESLFSDSEEEIIPAELKKQLQEYIELEKADKDRFTKLKKELVTIVKEDRDTNSKKEKDSIGNLTLLSAKINRAYKNAIFPQKRKEIIEKDSAGRFVPICTKNVFLKNFSSGITKSVYWTVDDIKQYTADIVRVLTVNNFVERV